MARASSGATRIDVRRASSTTKSLPSPFILRKGMVALPDMAHIWRGGSKRQSNELALTGGQSRRYSRHNEQPGPSLIVIKGPGAGAGLEYRRQALRRP